MPDFLLRCQENTNLICQPTQEVYLWKLFLGSINPQKNAMDSLHDRDSPYRPRRASIDKVTKRHRARNIASNSMNIAEAQANQEEYWRLFYVASDFDLTNL